MDKISKFWAVVIALIVSAGICLLITMTTPITFEWLAAPVLIIFLLAYLDHLLKRKLSTRAPIVFLLGMIFFGIVGWHLLMLSMPHTADALKSWQLYSDLMAFTKKVPNIAAMEHLTKYQSDEDTITARKTKQHLDSALKGDDSQLDSALAVMKKNKGKFEKITQFISNDVVKEEKPDVRKKESLTNNNDAPVVAPVTYVPPVIKKSKPVVTKLGDRYYRVDFDANDTVRVPEFKVKKGDHYWFRDPSTVIYIKDTKKVYNIPYSMEVVADSKNLVIFYTKEKGSLILCDN